MDVVLGIDLGTSYFKLGLIDRRGRMAGLSRIPVPVEGTEPLRRELPVDRFWEMLGEGVRQACGQAGVPPESVRAVSYSSQANSLLLLDARCRALTPIILWSDLRAAAADPALAELWSRPDFLETTGNRLQGPELGVAKLRWLRAVQPELWSSASHIMSLSDYLTFALTGERSGDEATAALLGLRDVSRHRWWTDALTLLDIPEDRLSSPRPPGTAIGRSRGTAAPRLGLPAAAVFAVGSLDHHAAALGAGLGCLAPVSESTGTVLACLAETERFEPRAEYCLAPAAEPGRYFKLAFNENGASALQWYRDRWASRLSIDELIAQAGRAPRGCGGLAALPGAGRHPGLQGFRLTGGPGEMPEALRSRIETWIGESVRRRPGSLAEPGPESPLHGYFARALMESTAASLLELFQAVGAGRRVDRIVATGGGAYSDLWLQIKADLLGIDVLTGSVPEPACFGAGLFASVAAGWFESVRQAAAAWIRPDRRFLPNADHHAFYSRRPAAEP